MAIAGDAATATIGSAPPPHAPAGGSYPLFVMITGVCPGEATIGLTLVREPGRPPREAITIAAAVFPLNRDCHG